MSDFVLLLTKQPRVNVRAVSRALARLFRVPLSDVTTPLRKAWGVLFETGLPEEQARAAAEIFREAGQPVAMLERDRLVPHQRPRRITWAEPTEDNLSIGAVYEKERHGIPWSQLFCLSVGLIHLDPPEVDVTGSDEFLQMMQLELPEERELMRERVARQLLDRGDEAGGVSTRPTQLGESEEIDLSGLGSDAPPVDYHLDLLLADPWHSLRISCNDFCYASKSGDGHSALSNFRALIDSIIAAAPDCYLTEITRQFVRGEVPESNLFVDMDEFEAYTRWFCNRQLAGLREPVAEPAEPPAPAEVDPHE